MNFDTYFQGQLPPDQWPAFHSRLGRLFMLEIVRHVLPLSTNKDLHFLFKCIEAFGGPFPEMNKTWNALKGLESSLLVKDNVSYWLARSMGQMVIQSGNLHRVAWPLTRVAGTHAGIQGGDFNHDFETAKNAEEGYQIHLAFCLLEHWSSVSSEWPSLKGLAQTILEERDFALMPILGDALGEMGECEMEAHTREKVHGPGCWVLDRILGLRN